MSWRCRAQISMNRQKLGNKLTYRRDCRLTIRVLYCPVQPKDLMQTAPRASSLILLLHHAIDVDTRISNRGRITHSRRCTAQSSSPSTCNIDICMLLPLPPPATPPLRHRATALNQIQSATTSRIPSRYIGTKNKRTHKGHKWSTSSSKSPNSTPPSLPLLSIPPAASSRTPNMHPTPSLCRLRHHI